MGRIRYMAKGLDCKWIILDHLSIVVSDQDTGDERKAIDSIMTNLRKLVQETGVGLFLVSHLKRPNGSKAHEDGGKISLGELRPACYLYYDKDTGRMHETSCPVEDENF